MLAGSTWKNLNMQSSQIPSVPLSDREHHAQFIAPPPHPSPRTATHHAPDCAAPDSQDTQQHWLSTYAKLALPLPHYEHHTQASPPSAVPQPVDALAAEVKPSVRLVDVSLKLEKAQPQKRNDLRAYPPKKGHMYRTMEHPDYRLSTHVIAAIR